jgi:TonB family protein
MVSSRLVVSIVAFWLVVWHSGAGAVPPSSESNAQLARQLPGTWELVLAQRPKASVLRRAFTTFQPDQTFTGLAILQLGGVDGRIEVKGTWRIENGTLVEKITASSAPGAVSASSDRIVSISSSEFVTRNAQGQEERNRKGRIPKSLPPLLSSDIAFFLKHALPNSVTQQAIVVAPKPMYSLEARRGRKIGKGLFGLIVDKPRGKVSSVRVLVSTGHRVLDDATRDALMRWQFKPRIVDKALVPVTFTLTSRRAAVASE